MATSVVDICNLALAALGNFSIISLEEASSAAQACRTWYEPSRDATLRAYPWNCATSREALAASTTAPAWGYANRYPLPVACLRVLQIENELLSDAQRGDRTGLWKIEKRAIVTDLGAPLKIVYIERIADPALFDPLLVEVLAARLAASIAYRVTGAQSAVEGALKAYRDKLAEARTIDAQEGSPDGFAIEPDWVTVR